MSKIDPQQVFSLTSALEKIPGPEGQRFTEVFRRGSLVVELYAPRYQDPQLPHLRDEIYIVQEGRGTFYNGKRRLPFSPGDLLFVPAGVEHRFEDFTNDLILWVIFFGPEKHI